MKLRKAEIGLLLYFTLYQTEYFWGKYLDSIDGFLLLLYVFLGIVLSGYWLFDSLKNHKKRLKGWRAKLRHLSFLLVLALPLIFPYGIINFERFKSPPIWMAYREGVANCTTRFIFRENGKFERRSVCFGTNHDRGNYIVKDDTIFLYYKGQKIHQMDTIVVDFDIKKTQTVQHLSGETSLGIMEFYTRAK